MDLRYEPEAVNSIGIYLPRFLAGQRRMATAFAFDRQQCFCYRKSLPAHADLRK
jgi:hypothetical protein